MVGRTANLWRLAALAVGLFVAVAAAGDEPRAPAATAQQVSVWIGQLDADEYDVRDAATRQLISAGLAAIPRISEALQTSGWEVTTRCIFVLQELALLRDTDTEEAALRALEAVAAASSDTLARRANDALLKLEQLRQKRAVEVFKSLGARIISDHEERDLFRGTVQAIEIGPDWKGRESDLRRLRWLQGVQQVTFIGDQVTDRWFEHLLGMDELMVLKVKRGRVTDAASRYFRQLPGLRSVKLLYVPLTDASVAHLKDCRHFMQLKIYGSRITDQGVRTLLASLGPEVVDFRKGAFLGISPSDNTALRWFINNVTENSAADKAGLLPGDMIAKYNGHAVTNFMSLTQLIGQNDVGDTVPIEIIRSGKTRTINVTFGEWE